MCAVPASVSMSAAQDGPHVATVLGPQPTSPAFVTHSAHQQGLGLASAALSLLQTHFGGF